MVTRHRIIHLTHCDTSLWRSQARGRGLGTFPATVLGPSFMDIVDEVSYVYHPTHGSARCTHATFMRASLKMGCSRCPNDQLGRPFMAPWMIWLRLFELGPAHNSIPT